MKQFKLQMKRFKEYEMGQGLIEYGLILALVSVVAVGALGEVGTKVNNTFNKVNKISYEQEAGDSEYVATDEDFSGVMNGEFRYIGDKDVVYIPHQIKGVDITSYRNMFSGSDVKKVISDNPNVIDMSYMFHSSKADSIDLSSLVSSNVTNMQNMFQYSKATNLNLRGFNTSKVEDASRMFNYTNVKQLDVSSFDTRSMTTMYGMFAATKVSDLDLSSFDTSNVKSMGRMFRAISVPILDLRTFDTSNVTDTGGMFLETTITKGYARSLDDTERLNSSSGKPNSLVFITK